MAIESPWLRSKVWQAKVKDLLAAEIEKTGEEVTVDEAAEIFALCCEAEAFERNSRRAPHGPSAYSPSIDTSRWVGLIAKHPLEVRSDMEDKIERWTEIRRHDRRIERANRVKAWASAVAHAALVFALLFFIVAPIAILASELAK